MRGAMRSIDRSIREAARGGDAVAPRRGEVRHHFGPPASGERPAAGDGRHGGLAFPPARIEAKAKLDRRDTRRLEMRTRRRPCRSAIWPPLLTWVSANCKREAGGRHGFRGEGRIKCFGKRLCFFSFVHPPWRTPKLMSGRPGLQNGTVLQYSSSVLSLILMLLQVHRIQR